MALTDAEKRKLLRERRAAKVKNGTSRLNKITGERTGLDHEQSQSQSQSPEPEPTINSKNDDETEQHLNRRISRAFDSDLSEQSTTGGITSGADIPNNNISSSSSSSNKKEVNLDDEDEFEKELQKIQEFLHKEQQHDQHKHISNDPFAALSKLGLDPNSSGNANGNGNEQFNPFGEQFSQLQALLNGQTDPKDFESFLNTGFDGTNGGQSDRLSPEEVEYNKNLKTFQKQQNAYFKAKFLLFKFVTLSILTVFSFFQYDYTLNKFNNGEYVSIPGLNGISRQFQILTIFEILTTFIIFFKLSRTKDDEYDYKFSSYLYYLQFIPDAFLSNSWKQRIRLSIKYLEVLQFILFDLSVIVVITGLLSVLI